NNGVSTNVGLFPDATELMYTGVSADISSVADDYMSSERGRIRHNHSITDKAIMGDMCLGHDEAIVSKLSEHSTTRCSSMNRNNLANLVTSSDPGFGRLTFVFQILRRQTNRDKRKDMSLSSNGCATVNNAVRLEPDSIVYFHLIAYDAVRTDETV